MHTRIDIENFIERILEEHRIGVSNVYIGDGAISRGSEIHININSKHNLGKFAIQYEGETETIAFWEIEKRVEIGASLNLYIKEYKWKDVNALILRKIGVKGYKGISTNAAAMPLNIFPFFLENCKEFGFSTNDISDDQRKDHMSSFSVEKDGKEGKKIWYYTSSYERDRNLRKEAIAIHGMKCQACGFDFKKTYGCEYIEVHHKVPLSAYNGSKKVNPKTDLVCLCSNCHSVVHHYDRNHTLTIKELKEIISKKRVD